MILRSEIRFARSRAQNRRESAAALDMMAASSGDQWFARLAADSRRWAERFDATADEMEARLRRRPHRRLVTALRRWLERGGDR